MPDTPREQRLQIMLTLDELEALDTWRFKTRMPSRAAAVRELLRRGLSAEGFALADGSRKSSDFGVEDRSRSESNARRGDGDASNGASDGHARRMK
jgi:hypothetical protein